MSQKNDSDNVNNDKMEEEEVLVYVDIEPTSLTGIQIKKAGKLKMVGNERKILLQVNNRFFEGEFDYAIGTNVFFERDPSVQNDHLFSPLHDSLFSCVSKTNKLLRMNRILLKEHDADGELCKENEGEEALDLKVSQNYEQTLNMFLPPNKNPPRILSASEDIDEEP